MPGSHVPILPVELIPDTSMDYLLILPWNIKTEIISQLKDIAGDKVKFVTAIPSLEIS